LEVYLVDTSNRFSDEQLLRLWQLMIPWFIKSAAGYEIVCETAKRGSERIMELLSEHAEIKEERNTKGRAGVSEVFLKGKADKNLEDILLSGPLPDESVPADLSPCREILLYQNDVLRFSCYDYGVFQTLYFNDHQETQAFLEILKNADIPPNIIEKR
jgi:hypothetical protein